MDHMEEEEEEHNWASLQTISSSSNDNTFLYPIPPWPQELPNSWSFPIQDSKAAASASNSHSQSEKRRRDRINAQLGILRKLVPESDKMDKAALLGSVIEQVKELKEKAMEVSQGMEVPTEIDEVRVEELVNNSDNKMFIRASVCCEDRPELLPELIRAVKGLRLNIVGADIASVGGRVKSILILSHENIEACSSCSSSLLSSVKQSFNLALSRISSSMPSNFRVRSKRQRFFLPSQ